MRLLLDTNVFIWLQSDRARLGDALAATSDDSNELYLSAVSAWEIAIKYAVGKLPLPESPVTFVPDRMARIGAHALNITMAVVLATTELAMHHRDPFDRLLVAQAGVEGMTILTGDKKLSRYAVPAIVV